jgi:Fe-Mn family superoxide dismutase
MTMEIHYSKHHKAYFDNFMKAIAGTDLEKMEIEDIFKQMSKQPAAVRNNAGGYYNHILFWESMSPKAGGKPEGKLLEAIVSKFGSFEDFKTKFSDAGKTRFGSGWAWLSVDEKGQIFISSTANQDNPMMDVVDQKGTPILALDVWEHAYYLKYQNKRPDYIAAFWNVVDWKKVESRYSKLVTK